MEKRDAKWALENDRFLVKKTFDFNIGKLGGHSPKFSNKINVVFEISAGFSAYPRRC